MLSFFGMKMSGEKKKSDEDIPTTLNSPGDTFLSPSLTPQPNIHDIRNIRLPPLPRPDARPGSAASSRSPSAAQRSLASPINSDGASSPVDANGAKQLTGSAPAAWSHRDRSVSPGPRITTPGESPVSSRPGTAADRYKALTLVEPQHVRDHPGPKSPLVQSHRVEAYVLGEPSPMSEHQPETAIIVSPMSSDFTEEEHSPVQDSPPSPPGSFAEFRKPEAEEPRPTRGAHRGPPPIITTLTVGNPEIRQGPRPAPLPSPAPSGLDAHDGGGCPDEDPWGIPVIQTVQVHRDALTVVAPRQLSITTSIVTSARSPLAEFRFNDDDAEVLASARRTSSPIDFGEMNRDHKPLPLVLQRPAARIPENGVPSPLASPLPPAGDRSEAGPPPPPKENTAPPPLLQDGVPSPLASPPQDRAAAGLGICGNWPLDDGILPGVSPEPLPRCADPDPGPPAHERVRLPPGDLGGPDGARGPTPDNRGLPREPTSPEGGCGPMAENRGPPASRDPMAGRGPMLAKQGPPGEPTSPQGVGGPMAENRKPPVSRDPRAGRGPMLKIQGPSGEPTSPSRARGPMPGDRGPPGEPTSPDDSRGPMAENRGPSASRNPMAARGPMLEKQGPPGEPTSPQEGRGPTPENRGPLGGPGRPNGAQDPMFDNRRLAGPNGVHRPMYDNRGPPGGQGGPGGPHAPAPENKGPPGGLGAPNWPVRGPSLENRGPPGEQGGPNAARGPMPGMRGPPPPGGPGGSNAAYGPRLDSRGPPGGMGGSGAARGPMFENRGPPAQQDPRGPASSPSDGMRRPGPGGQGHRGRGYPRPGPANMRPGGPPGPPPGYHPGPPPRHQPGMPPGHHPGPQFGPHTGPPSGPPSRHQPAPPSGYHHGASSGAHSGPRHPHFRNQGPGPHRGPPGPTQPPMNGPSPNPGYGRGPTMGGGPPPSLHPPGSHEPGEPLVPPTADLRTRKASPGPSGPRNAVPRGPPPSAPPPPIRVPLPLQVGVRLSPENPAQPQPHPPDLSIQPADSDLRFDFPAAPTSPNPDPSDGGPPASKWTTPRPAPLSPAQLASKSQRLDNPNWPFAAAAPETSQPVAAPDLSPGSAPEMAVLTPPPRNPLRACSPRGHPAPRG